MRGLDLLGDLGDGIWDLKGDSFGSGIDAIKELQECLKIYRDQESLAILKQKATYDHIQLTIVFLYIFVRVLN